MAPRGGGAEGAQMGTVFFFTWIWSGPLTQGGAKRCLRTFDLPTWILRTCRHPGEADPGQRRLSACLWGCSWKHKHQRELGDRHQGPEHLLRSRGLPGWKAAQRPRNNGDLPHSEDTVIWIRVHTSAPLCQFPIAPAIKMQMSPK